jgi:hypothetical protein
MIRIEAHGVKAKEKEKEKAKEKEKEKEKVGLRVKAVMEMLVKVIHQSPLRVSGTIATGSTNTVLQKYGNSEVLKNTILM